MKLVKRCLLSLSLFAATTAAHAQSAEEIISKHIDAIGGKEKLRGINSVKYTNTMQVMGTEAPATIVILNGKGLRSESELNGQKMVQVFSDKGAWMINPMMGSGSPEPMPETQAKAGQEQIFVVPLLNYTATGSKADYLGHEKISQVDAIKVKLTDKSGNATTHYFDPATYYLIRSVRTNEIMGQQMEVTTSFSDFKKTDYGWVVPQTTDINMGGQFSLTAKLKNVEVNVPVEASVFEMKK